MGIPFTSPLSALLLILATGVSTQAQTASSTARSPRKTENVFLITLDGMRWQEIFGGLRDDALADSSRVQNRPALREKYERATVEQRRETLMPFLWTVLAKQGQIFGDPSANAGARVLNRHRLSYPGYNEMLCGFPDDDRISSNANIPNPNQTVLEWLSQRPGLENKVAAYGTWDRLPSILNVSRSKLPVQSAWTPIADKPLAGKQGELNDWQRDLPHLWEDAIFDAWIERAAMEYVGRHQPRVFYVMFTETDSWGHERRYDAYLEAAHNTDAFIGRLWTMLQSTPRYAGRTSLLITTDHGRGAAAKDWGKHNGFTAGSDEIWIAVLGPDTPALGVRKDVHVTQGQIAATLAALVGEDYHAAVPQSAAALPDVAR